MKFIIFFILVFSFLNATTVDSETTCILSQYGIDEDAKSAKGWLRILNDKERLESYGYTFTEAEISIIKDYFNKKLKDERERTLR